MPSLPFLSRTLPLYDQHLASWHREERRFYGADAVLEELLQWKGETENDWAARKAAAGYMTLPKIHAQTLTGHLTKETPEPEYGKLGKVRRRSEIDRPSLAEILHYNVDGIGQDGTELMPWFDAVQERAIATGYRWVLVEMPTLGTLREIRLSHGGDPEGPLTMQDVLEGFRPYAVEYSPTSVPLWRFTNGRLDFAVINITINPETVIDDGGDFLGAGEGCYLLVRRGFAGLGETYAGGGWWKYDREHKLLESGDWTQTLGQIPLFMFVGEPSTGTSVRPAVARSLTMELGQIAVGLMVLRSARDYNMIQAGKSVNHVLGIDPDNHGKILEQQDLGSITIGYPPVMGPDGRVIIPQIWNSSAAMLDAGAFESVITSGIQEAREIMVKQVTSTPDSSGRSKEAGFAEATSPLLARLAGTRQQALNTFLYFASLRLGIQQPNASVTIPRDYNLQPVIDDIDAMLSTLKRSWLRSPTWEKELIIRAGDERGLLPEDAAKRTQIENELLASATPTEPQEPTADDEETSPGRRARKAVDDLMQAGGNGAQGG